MHESFPTCHLIHSTVSPGIFYQAIHHLTFFSRTIRLEYMKIPSNSVPETNAFFREMETDTAWQLKSRAIQFWVMKIIIT